MEWWLKLGDIAPMIKQTYLSRDRAIVALAYSCGLRRDEISMLDRNTIYREHMLLVEVFVKQIHRHLRNRALNIKYNAASYDGVRK